MTIFISEILFKKFINLKRNDNESTIFYFYEFFGCIKTETIYSTINTFLFKISENIFYK